MNKNDARKTALSCRNQLTDSQVEKLSCTICEKVNLDSCSEILTYVNYGKEVSTRPVIEAAWKKGIPVAVPKVVSPGKMEFRYIESFQDLEPGTMGILEPKDYCRPLEVSQNRLIIMPGVAFDKEGNRVGYGGGFYDRWIAENASEGDDFKVALAFETQMVDAIDAEEHDLKPDVIITEKRMAITGQIIYNK